MYLSGLIFILSYSLGHSHVSTIPRRAWALLKRGLELVPELLRPSYYGGCPSRSGLRAGENETGEWVLRNWGDGERTLMGHIRLSSDPVC